jgi:hypothetical protein
MGLKVGDKVTRMLAGTIPMTLVITEIKGDRILCGDYEFDKVTGAEIDDFLGWGAPPKMTGSFIAQYSHAPLPEDEIERNL